AGSPRRPARRGRDRRAPARRRAQRTEALAGRRPPREQSAKTRLPLFYPPSATIRPMFFLIGLAVVVGSVLGGYLPHGDIRVLWQPLEFLIILGAALGSFIISTPKPVLFGTGARLGRLMKGPPHSKTAYVELLTLLFTLFKLAKSKGALALEQHVEKPEE